MKILTFSLALIASSHAADIHGCAWLPDTVAVINFTYIHYPVNATNTDFVKWDAPAVSVSCNATNPSPYQFFFPCIGEEKYGTLKISADNAADRNATIKFNMYAQCAADIYEIWYTGNLQLECQEDGEADVVCGTKGNVTASISAANYLPPIRNPPPPPTHWRRDM
ncbi:hypothetical protein IQ06DRAFT_376024 [Phaeosphaeriaceae sp. SRC1lsM3a]|nr:hypothetical protein IQ06DRAFT_376024 [Stagonospora sp. SRC1lsM3a]